MEKEIPISLLYQHLKGNLIRDAKNSFVNNESAQKKTGQRICDATSCQDKIPLKSAKTPARFP